MRCQEVRAYGDADALAQAMAATGEADLVAERLRRGCRAFAAWSGGALAGYGWLTQGPEWIGEMGAQISPGPAEAYLWNCVTLPDHRLRGVFSGLVEHVCGVAADEGLARLWIASLEGTAEPALERAGFQPLLRIEDVQPRGPARRH